MGSQAPPTSNVPLNLPDVLGAPQKAVCPHPLHISGLNLSDCGSNWSFGKSYGELGAVIENKSRKHYPFWFILIFVADEES